MRYQGFKQIPAGVCQLSAQQGAIADSAGQIIRRGGVSHILYDRFDPQMGMYTGSVTRIFVTQQYLTVPNPGAERELRSHNGTAEITFGGPERGEDGSLGSLNAVAEAVGTAIDSFRDQTLNELAAFEMLTPSAEHLGRLFATRLTDQLTPESAMELTVAIQADDAATVSHTRSV